MGRNYLALLSASRIPMTGIPVDWTIRNKILVYFDKSKTSPANIKEYLFQLYKIANLTNESNVGTNYIEQDKAPTKQTPSSRNMCDWYSRRAEVLHNVTEPQRPPALLCAQGQPEDDDVLFGLHDPVSDRVEELARRFLDWTSDAESKPGGGLIWPGQWRKLRRSLRSGAT